MTELPDFFDNLCASDFGGPKTCFMDRAIGLLPSMIYVFNQETQSNEYSNRSVGELMGYNAEEVRGFGSNLMAMLCHPEDLPNVFQHFKRISRLPDGEVISIEYRVRHKDDRWVWFLSQDTVFDRHPDGRVLRHLGTATEITSLKQAEQRAIEASYAAQVANEDLRTFAYSISHDMKSPTNTLEMILSEIEHAHGSSLDPDASHLIDQARQTVESMRRRIERVLDYTRMIDKKASFHSVDLNAVMDGVLADMAGDISATKAEIEIGPMPVVSGRTEELKVLFQNLLENALKFRKAEKPARIKVLHDSDPLEPGTQITVSDEGIGIAEDSHERIFGMFKRLHPEKAYSGAGLGLAICRRIAISHGGDLSVASRPDKGTTFTVHLQSPDQGGRLDVL